jgi:tetratricopeptide (TPR) repeat protein
LAAAVVLAAWILSSQLNKRAEPSPPAPAVPLPLPAVVAAPPPLHPPEAWSAAAGVVDDAQAVSALILALDGKWSDAHRHVRGMYRAIAPGDAKSARKHNDVGLAFFRTGDYASAAKAFDLALRADPADAEAANNLGYAYIKAGRVREGVPCLVRALRLVPARSSAWINLSEALAELGHDDAALAGLLLAVRYSANRDEIREFLIEAAREHSSNAFRKQAARALDQIASVPRS